MHTAYDNLLKCCINKGVEFQPRISEIFVRATLPKSSPLANSNNKNHPDLHLTLILRS